ncbi:MAG: sugar ABC transporter substrate-binding protein [Actinomycetota bacterium]
MRKRTARAAAGLVALSMVAAACGSDDDGDAADDGDDASASEADAGDDAGDDEAMDEDEGEDAAPAGDGPTLDYWLWDNNQQPFYQECAANFTEQTGININVVQLGWGEYWDGLTAGFATGDVPDVFTNHLAQYPSFVDSGVLVPLNDFVEADGVDVGIYADGLADLWVAPDGSRYGLPKDFDTISLVVNQDALADAGLTMDDLANLDWNPEDGGTFESTIAALSVDSNGVRGNEDGFDAGSVETYGYISNTGYADAYSQTGWSAFTATTGWDYLDTNPWGTVYNYDQPEFTDTMLWWASLIEKGYMPDSETLAGSGADTIFADGGAATMTDGSWKIGTWTGPDATFAVDFAPTPIGPNGGRASMFNGLADSITTASENPDEAWEWVKYLGSAECQDIIGAGGVVFPAIPSATALAEQAFADKGADVSAFTIHVDEGTTFLFPISIEGAEVQNIVGTAIDAVMRGEGDAQTLIDANAEINDLIADAG